MDPEGDHLTAREVEAYRKRTMAEPARRIADKHLAGCDVCMELVLDADGPELAVTRLSEAFLAPEESPFHMSAADMAAYTKGSLDEADRVVFESHLENCPECKAACGAEDRSNRIRKRSPVVLHADASGAGIVSGLDLKGGNHSPVRESWTRFRAVRYVAGIAAVLMILFLVWATWRSTIESRRVQQASAGDQATPTPAHDNSGGHAGDDRSSNRTQNEEGSPGRPLAASLRDGDHDVGLDQEGNLVGLGGLAKSDEASIKAALESGKVPKPSVLRKLTGGRIRLMDRSTDGWPFKLVEPVQTAVAEDQPEFQWERLAGAASYTVYVFDANFDLVVKSEPQAVTRWRAPIRLRRGQVYSWEVTALKDGKEVTAPTAPAPRSQFRVLRPAELAELRDARERQPRSHLALGVLYARMGLVKAAETEFNTIASENPDSAIARKLLAEAKSWMAH